MFALSVNKGWTEAKIAPKSVLLCLGLEHPAFNVSSLYSYPIIMSCYTFFVVKDDQDTKLCTFFLKCIIPKYTTFNFIAERLVCCSRVIIV